MPISFNNISKGYEGRAVLENISFSIEDGGFACITGKSGVGKTTLMNILAGILKPDDGELSGLEAYGKISAVFQEDRLLPWFDALGNVEFVLARDKNSRQAAARVLNSLGIADEDMEKNVSQLSGGMRRRVEIARALAADFDLLLMDEPFKGLDDATKFSVIDRVLELCQKKTAVMITHDLDEIEYIKNKIPATVIDLQAI